LMAGWTADWTAASWADQLVATKVDLWGSLLVVQKAAKLENSWVGHWAELKAAPMAGSSVENSVERTGRLLAESTAEWKAEKRAVSKVAWMEQQTAVGRGWKWAAMWVAYWVERTAVGSEEKKVGQLAPVMAERWAVLRARHWVAPTELHLVVLRAGKMVGHWGCYSAVKWA